MINSSLKLLITGGNGQLATSLQQRVDATTFKTIALDRQALDITDPTAIKKTLEKYQPDLIVNTAAYTAVDKAESEQETANAINHLGAKNLAEACHLNKLKLIHVSTDYVFDGEKSSDYLEEDPANPINIYGKTKWLGEEAVRNTCENHIILRVSGVFSHHGNNFYKTILRLTHERKELRIVSDQTTCPTYAGDIADTILTIASDMKKFGTYHYCSKPKTSWYEFANTIITKAKETQPLLAESIIAITTNDYPTPAKRPKNSALNCTKIMTDYGITQPSWLDAIIQLQKGIIA